MGFWASRVGTNVASHNKTEPNGLGLWEGYETA